MYALNRHLVAGALLLAIWTLAGRASAWVESSIESDAATIDLERDGKATVEHQILVKVRGGPFMGFELPGADPDAELMPDASVSPAESGHGASASLPLIIDKKDDGTLRIEIDAPKGVRSGSYLFKLRYRTNFVARDLLQPAGTQVDVHWTGPRFDDGIDSARVVFRVPPAVAPPHLPEHGAAGEPIDGLFIANLHRAADKDELEVVRPHVAKGEPVVWRIDTDAKAFDAFAPPVDVPALAPMPEDAPMPARTRAVAIGIGLGILLTYAMLVLLKWRATAEACKLRGGSPRALIGIPVVLRSVLAGSALAGAAAVGAMTELPTLAGALLLLSIVLAVQLPPRAKAALRAPGRWLPLSDDEAFGRSKRVVPGRWLDAGSVRGFVVFALALAGFAVGAVRLLPHSPYHALMLALATACLLPVFCTGRASELPADPVQEPRALLAWLAKRLRKDATLKVVPWARIPDASADPDELRLLMMPRRALPGLTSIEIGVEYHHGIGGPIALPCLLVRAIDGSETYRALPRSVVWSRGRKPEERVAVIRPKLPTRRMCLSLARRLAAMLSVHAQSSKGSRSAGRGDRSAKPGTLSSPLQAA